MPTVRTAFSPPITSTAAHIRASGGENAGADKRIVLRAVESKIGQRDDDSSTRTIQQHLLARFEATRPEVKWWDLPGRIRRSLREKSHEQAVLVLSMGAADGTTDGLYVGRRGLLFGSEGSNFFQLTDKVPERALEHAAGADQGAAFMERLDLALEKIAGRIANGESVKIREASFKPYVA